MSMHACRIRRFCIGLILGLGVTATAQEPKLAFEVVSIKRATTAFGPSNLNDAQGGHFSAENVSLGQLIRLAYGIRPAGQDYSDLTGAPGWFYSEHYDIRATTSRQPTRAELLGMLRTMLTDQFQLRTHTVSHEESILELQPARQGGRLGPGLTVATVECTAPSQKCSLINAPGKISGTAVPMEGLAHMLTDWVDGHIDVRDRTGLTGRYAVELNWNGDDLPLVTAIQDQLGLKLVAAKAQVPVMVVDAATRPEPN